MPTFSYRAKKISGEEITGLIEAPSRFRLAEQLRKDGYILVSYKEKKDHTTRVSMFAQGLFGNVSIVDKMIFARNLSEMIGAGVSLTRGLNVLSRQTQNGRFRKILTSMEEGIRKGNALSQVMADYPGVFTPIFRAMVRAGEVSGQLEESLKLISQQLERDYDLRRKVRSALMYPSIILAAMIVIGILMMLYVVPTLISTFQELKIELPLTTKVIIGISNFLLTQGLVALIVAAGILIALYLFLQSGIGKVFVGTALLKLPVFSGLTKKINAARTARTFGSLVGAGVSVLEALEITEGVIQNHHFKNVLTKAKVEIQKGNPISSAFIENENIYPVLMGEMMQVGEETGKLSGMLFRLADFYEGEVAAETKDLSTIIEPVLMVVIGAAVGFFAISMITPLYSSLGNL